MSFTEDVFNTLIELLEKQEVIKITYNLKKVTDAEKLNDK